MCVAFKIVLMQNTWQHKWADSFYHLFKSRKGRRLGDAVSEVNPHVLGFPRVYSHPVLVSPSCSCALHQRTLVYGLWHLIEHTHLECFHPRICTCGQLMILDTCGKLMNLQGGWYARWKALLIWRTRLPIRIPWYTLSNAFWKSRKRAWTPIGSSGELSVILNHFCDMHASVDTVKLPLVKECWFWFIFKSCLCI